MIQAQQPKATSSKVVTLPPISESDINVGNEQPTGKGDKGRLTGGLSGDDDTVENSFSLGPSISECESNDLPSYDAALAMPMRVTLPSLHTENTNMNCDSEYSLSCTNAVIHAPCGAGDDETVLADSEEDNSENTSTEITPILHTQCADIQLSNDISLPEESLAQSDSESQSSEGSMTTASCGEAQFSDEEVWSSPSSLSHSDYSESEV